jgi:hypothetical protein
MRLSRSHWICCLVYLTGLLVQAQSPADPLTGTWRGDWGPTPTHRNAVTVLLKWDGKTLTGTINPGSKPIKLKKASFDPRTGILHLEADHQRMEKGVYLGKWAHYVIEGTLQDGTLIGDWGHDNQKGDFKLLKK